MRSTAIERVSKGVVRSFTRSFIEFVSVLVIWEDLKIWQQESRIWLTDWG